jgi:hypothetical protein
MVICFAAKATFANRCKQSTAKAYLLLTIKFACIEFNCLPLSIAGLGGGSCLDYFGSLVRKSTSRRAVVEDTQHDLHSFAARLHWRASPTLRKQMKAA